VFTFGAGQKATDGQLKQLIYILRPLPDKSMTKNNLFFICFLVEIAWIIHPLCIYTIVFFFLQVKTLLDQIQTKSAVSVCFIKA